MHRENTTAGVHEEAFLPRCSFLRYLWAPAQYFLPERFIVFSYLGGSEHCELSILLFVWGVASVMVCLDINKWFILHVRSSMSDHRCYRNLQTSTVWILTTFLLTSTSDALKSFSDSAARAVIARTTQCNCWNVSFRYLLRIKISHLASLELQLHELTLVSMRPLSLC